MKTWDLRLFTLAATIVIILSSYSPSPLLAQKAQDTTVAVCLQKCGSIREGRTQDDRETSSAVDQILEHCVRACRNVSQFYAIGRHLGEIKVDSSRRILREQRIEVAYMRPDRLRIALSDPSGRATARFEADGHQVLMVWDKQMGLFGGVPENLVYRIHAQPPLAAFVDEETDGDLYEDASGCLSASVVGPLFISRDPRAWLHSHVAEYFYDGIERVGNACCHRIRFHQSSPDLAVTQWIDCETGLIRKLSVVRAQTETGTPCWALGPAASGEMWVTIFDEITTGTLPGSLRFESKPPRGITEAKGTDETQPPRSTAASAPFLQRLLRAASGSALEKTSVSLENQWPREHWQVKRSWRFENHIAGISTGRARMVTIVTADGKVWLLDQKGLKNIPASLDFYPDMAVPCKLANQPAVVLARSGGTMIQAIDLEGHGLWTRSMPARVWCVAADDQTTPPRLWVGLESGLSQLDPTGRTLFSIRRQRNITQLVISHHPVYGRVLVGLTIQKPELWLYTFAGRPLAKLIPTDALIGAEPCDIATGLLMVGAISREGNELALRGLGPSAETIWTVSMAPRLDRLGGDFTSIRERTQEGVTQHFVAVTPKGKLREVDDHGRIVWDGELVFERLQTLLAGGTLAGAMTSGDLDCDGRDELYLCSDQNLVEIGLAH